MQNLTLCDLLKANGGLLSSPGYVEMRLRTEDWHSRVPQMTWATAGLRHDETLGTEFFR